MDDLNDALHDLAQLYEPGDDALANRLARLLYAAHGYVQREGYAFDAASHPQERLMFRLATIALNWYRENDH